MASISLNRRKRVVSAAVAAAIAFGGMTAPAAFARDVESMLSHPGRWIPSVHGDTVMTWAGAYHGPGSKLAWCIEAGKEPSFPAAYSGTVNKPQMAAVLSLYEDVATEESRAAISYLIRKHVGISQYEQQVAQDIANAFPEAKAKADQYWAEAAKYAGGAYSLKGNLVATDNGRKAHVTGVDLVAGTAPLPDREVTLTIQGPGVWEESGTTTLRTTTDPSLRHNVKVNGNGKLSVTSSTIGDLPNNDPLRIYRETDELQTMLVSGDGKKSVKWDSVSVPVSYKFQPTVKTQVVKGFVSEGDNAADTITVGVDEEFGEWIENAPVKFKGTLYGPYDSAQAAAANPPAGAPVAGTDEFTATGPGQHVRGENVITPKSGYYAWTWEMDKDAQSNSAKQLLEDSYSDGFFTKSETMITKMKPVIRTERNDRKIAPGDPLIDNVTLSITEGGKWLKDANGNPVVVSARGTAYGPFAEPLPQSDTVPADAPVAGRTSIQFTEAGTKATGDEVRSTSHGFYTWVWELAPSNYHDAYKTPFMEEIETTTAPKQELEHSSEAREYNVVLGGRAFDTIDIAGYIPNHGKFEGLGEWIADVKTATVTVYGPMEEAPSTEAVPADAPVFKQFEVPSVDGKFKIGYDEATKVEIPKDEAYVGHYVFVYHFKGDDRQESFTSPFNDILEQFYVGGGDVGATPQVATQATKSAIVGDNISDTALVTGKVKEGSHLVFRAYQPEGETPVCETPIWESDKIAVDRTGYYESGEFAAEKAGKVYWVETLYDANGKEIAKGKCGIPTETTEVTQPKVETKATPDTWIGRDAQDTAVVSGMPKGRHFELTFEAYRATEGAPVCEESNRVFSHTYGEVFRDGEYKSGTYTTTKDDAGKLYWVESLKNEDGKVIHRGECGLENETTKVHDPKVSTKAQPDAYVGQPAGDTAIVEGSVFGEPTLKFEAYSELMKDGKAVCEPGNLVFETTYGTITKPGEYASKTTVFNKEGKVFWVESLLDEDGFVIHRGECGLENETTKVHDPKVSTKAVDNVWAGQPAHDVAKVEGPIFGSPVLKFQAYAETKDKDGNFVCEKENLLFETTYGPVTKPGEYKSESKVFDKDMNIHWVESLVDEKDENTVIHRGKCGVENEITKVHKPKVTTRATATVTQGQPAKDTAVVEGRIFGEPTLKFEAYKATKGTDGKFVCEPKNRVFETTFGKIKSAGLYDSATTVFPEAGEYHWVETLVDENGFVIHRGQCGIENEITKVTPNPKGGLAKTGANATMLGLLAGGLLIAGGGAGYAAYRRNRKTEDVVSES